MLGTHWPTASSARSGCLPSALALDWHTFPSSLVRDSLVTPPCAGWQVHNLVEAAEVVRPDWNGYNILHDSASRVAALDVGFLPGPNAHQAPSPKLVWLLAADDWQPQDIPEDAFVIYQVPAWLLWCWMRLCVEALLGESGRQALSGVHGRAKRSGDLLCDTKSTGGGQTAPCSAFAQPWL